MLITETENPALVQKLEDVEKLASNRKPTATQAMQTISESSFLYQLLAVFEKWPGLCGAITGLIIHIGIASVSAFFPSVYYPLIPQSFLLAIPLLIAVVISSAVYKVLGVAYSRVKNHHKDEISLGKNRNKEIQRISIEAFASISEVRDKNVGQGRHIKRMGHHAKVIAETLASHPEFKQYVTRQYAEDILIAAPLHDIGKIGIADKILNKPARLTLDEFEIIKMHTIIGGDLMAELERKLPYRTFYTLGKEIAYHHHQRWDGQGYPNVLRVGDTTAFFVQDNVGKPLTGEQIPLSARIVAVADVYDALVSKRSYKDAYTHEKAKQIILAERAKHFDPAVVDAFIAAEERIIEYAIANRD
jgi:response regulator RpfG family c-di-GMP phosphodiesterase